MPNSRHWCISSCCPCIYRPGDGRIPHPHRPTKRSKIHISGINSWSERVTGHDLWRNHTKSTAAALVSAKNPHTECLRMYVQVRNYDIYASQFERCSWRRLLNVVAYADQVLPWARSISAVNIMTSNCKQLGRARTHNVKILALRQNFIIGRWKWRQWRNHREYPLPT
jgi:hypothetical protein